jgi:hypothetical protein
MLTTPPEALGSVAVAVAAAPVPEACAPAAVVEALTIELIEAVEAAELEAAEEEEEDEAAADWVMLKYPDWARMEVSWEMVRMKLTWKRVPAGKLPLRE